MRKNTLFLKRFAQTLFMLGLASIMFGLVGSQSAAAAAPVTIHWDDISPDISPDPDFVENAANPTEIDTYFSVLPAPHTDPYHGLSSSVGGVAGFGSQTFTNVENSGVDVTVYYSSNNYDGAVLEGPDLYRPIINENPDRAVTGEWLLRMTRDHVGTRTPTTVVLSFSESVFMNEYIVGSLSLVGASYEHAVIRAFATPNATGPIVKASGFINISNLSDCSTLLLDQCVPGPIVTNLLSNVQVDPDLIDVGLDGTYDNVGSVADNGVYHVYGTIPQSGAPGPGYGRVKAVYETTPIRSIAVSFFPTDFSNPNPFTDTSYTDQWISTIMAPYTFTPQAPTAITMEQVSITEQNAALLTLGLVLLLIAVSGLIIGRRFASREEIS